MKVLVATDAWHPQVNGVVHTLGHVAREGRALGAELEFLSPDQFWRSGWRWSVRATSNGGSMRYVPMRFT